MAEGDLRAMAAALAHRGPDGEGIWINPAGTAGLVHRRLAVIDPIARSDQPMGRGGLHMTFNGEIYNYRALRSRLAGPWQTEGDSEVILAAWQRDGAGAIDHLRGMFAIAIWDEGSQTLHLVRDRMGQKPLYVRHGEDFIAFASEIPALLALAPSPRSLIHGARAYAAFGYSVGQTTPYPGILAVLPGRHLTWRDGQASEREYFSVDRPGSAPAEPLPELLQEAVREQTVADVPLGCFLSGGVDSSIVTLLLKRALPGQHLHTFSVGFDDTAYDESAFAQEVAVHLGTVHHPLTVGPEVRKWFEPLIKVMGEPFCDSSILATTAVSHHARQFVTVCLSGDGGDELFGGYDRYRAMRMAQRLQHLGWLLRPVGRLLSGGPPKSRLARAARFAEGAQRLWTSTYAAYTRLAAVQSLGTTELPNPHAKPPLDESDWVMNAIRWDRRNYLPHDLLNKVDRASMLHALEVRSPFMDHRVVAWAVANVTARHATARPAKPHLHAAFAADLPATVFNRPKSGFALPLGVWWRGPWKEWLLESLTDPASRISTIIEPQIVQTCIDLHLNGTTDFGQRLYSLMTLEYWLREFAK